MRVAKFLYQDQCWSQEITKDLVPDKAQVVIGFGNKNLLTAAFCEEVRAKFPNAQLALCSSAGEIFSSDVYEDTVNLMAIQFMKTEISTTQINISEFKDSYEAGKAIMNSMEKERLRWVFVLSDGRDVNGSELVKGLNDSRPEGVLISGGLAGDGTNFKETLVGLNQVPEPGNIVAIGFHSDHLELSHASLGGWETFGLERKVTKSHQNKLYEIDGKNALDLYKRYLGKYSQELPGSAVLFPLGLRLEEGAEPIVRTILSINETENYMVFAGDIPEGSNVRFMKANFDRLIDAATDAAQSLSTFSSNLPKLAILVSCVGRKMALGNRISEEVEAVREILGENTAITGFYSYGEISPLKPMANCELHNQTITITGINEVI